MVAQLPWTPIHVKVPPVTNLAAIRLNAVNFRCPAALTFLVYCRQSRANSLAQRHEDTAYTCHATLDYNNACKLQKAEGSGTY